jgi:predicted N-acetyltransferase YhbS
MAENIAMSENAESFGIQQETAADYARVYELIVAAFNRDNEAKLVEALRRSDAFVPELSLVAKKGNDVVGYILFSKVKIAGHESHRALGIGPVAVSPEFQGEGIGSRLIRMGLKKAKEFGYDSVLLIGSPKYYPRFGFRPASNWNITTSYNEPTATFALELREGSLSGVSGLAQYAPEFALNDC